MAFVAGAGALLGFEVVAGTFSGFEDVEGIGVPCATGFDACTVGAAVSPSESLAAFCVWYFEFGGRIPPYKEKEYKLRPRQNLRDTAHLSEKLHR